MATVILCGTDIALGYIYLNNPTSRTMVYIAEVYLWDALNNTKFCTTGNLAEYSCDAGKGIKIPFSLTMPDVAVLKTCSAFVQLTANGTLLTPAMDTNTIMICRKEEKATILSVDMYWRGPSP